MQRAHASQRGHLYFELVEKGGRGIVGKIDAVLWRSDHQRVRRQLAESGQEIAEGQQIRCWGRVDFYGPAGRLQLIVRDVDPLFTLGHLERQRRETLAALAAAGLMERNRALPLAAVPLAVGLITSEGSAAFHDFSSGLAESGYGFRLVFVHAAMQGPVAEREVVSALGLLASLGGLDAIALVRGGGSRSDLAAFDTRAIAEAVARCPLPVLTGLGHQIDQAIADLVSHTALKTPTKVAEHLVERVAGAEQQLREVEAALVHLARQRLRRATEELRRSTRLAQVARLRLQAAAHSVAEVARALELASRRRLLEARRATEEWVRRARVAAERRIERRRRAPDILARRLADLAAGRLRAHRAVLDGIARLCRESAPERLLARGFSITRTTAGTIVRHPDQVGSGETILTRLAGGVVSSRVEKT